MEEPAEEQGLGVADAHGLIAAVCGLGVLGTSCVCCLDRIRSETVLLVVIAMGAATLWSGLFGIVTKGTAEGRALAWAGLAALALSTTILCMTRSFGGF